MLQHELTHVQSSQPASVMGSVVVSMPLQPAVNKASVAAEPGITLVEEEKTVEVLLVDEAEVEAELEEIKHNAAVMQQLKRHSKPHLIFDTDDDDIPTLTHQAGNKTKEIK